MQTGMALCNRQGCPGGQWTGTAGLCHHDVGMASLGQKASCQVTCQLDPPVLSASPRPPSWQPQPASAGTARYCMRGHVAVGTCSSGHPGSSRSAPRMTQALSTFRSRRPAIGRQDSIPENLQQGNSTELPAPPLRQPKEDPAATWCPCMPATSQPDSPILVLGRPCLLRTFCACRTPGKPPSQPEHEPHFGSDGH